MSSYLGNPSGLPMLPYRPSVKDYSDGDNEKRHYATRPEARLRREMVAYMQAQGLRPDKILGHLQKNGFPECSLNSVYDDIEHIAKHAKDYIALEYLPNFGAVFQRGVLTLEQIIAEAWQNYHEGETETHTSEKETKDGTFTTTTTIKRQGSVEWLRLAGTAAMAMIKLGDTGPVTKNISYVVSEYKRLKELERKGVLQVANRA